MVNCKASTGLAVKGLKQRESIFSDPCAAAAARLPTKKRDALVRTETKLSLPYIDGFTH